MAVRLTWSPIARRDFDSTINYIAADNPQAAARWAKAVMNSVRRLRHYPNSGRMIPEERSPNLREVILSPYRIVYRLHGDADLVEIVRIWHSARGVPDI